MTDFIYDDIPLRLGGQVFTPNSIRIGKRLRKANKKAVEELAKSISETGLMTRPVVYFDEDNEPVLVHGLHRIEALKLLGKGDEVLDLSLLPADVDPLLAEIDENLTRKELTPTERNKFRALRVKRGAKLEIELSAKRAEEAKAREAEAVKQKRKMSGVNPQNDEQPPTQDDPKDNGGRPVSARRQAIKDAAEAEGVSESTIERSVKRVEAEERGEPVPTPTPKPKPDFDVDKWWTKMDAFAAQAPRSVVLDWCRSQSESESSAITPLTTFDR